MSYLSYCWVKPLCLLYRLQPLFVIPDVALYILDKQKWSQQYNRGENVGLVKALIYIGSNLKVLNYNGYHVHKLVAINLHRFKLDSNKKTVNNCVLKYINNCGGNNF